MLVVFTKSTHSVVVCRCAGAARTCAGAFLFILQYIILYHIFVLYRCMIYLYYTISYFFVTLRRIIQAARNQRQRELPASRLVTKRKCLLFHESLMSLRIIVAAYHAMPSGPGRGAARIVCHYICIIWANYNIHYYICIIIIFVLYIIISASFGPGTIPESTLLPHP